MGTDDLTEMAGDVIVRAVRVSDTLKAELDAMARQFKFDNEWLQGVQGVRVYLEEIADDPAEYVDSWDLENEEGATATMIGSCATEICCRVKEILAVPLIKRGVMDW